MTAAHFFVDSLAEGVVRISGEDARHAARVLRIRIGETITVSDGRGSVASCVVRRIGDASERVVEATIDDRIFVPAATPRVIACPAVPKSGKLDLVVQKLTEIGVAEIRPWFGARSVVRWDARKSAAHGDRLRAVSREAAKQSRQAWLPLVADPGALADLPAVTVVLDEETEVRLSAALAGDAPDEVAVVVGPEGGLERSEIDALIARGAQPVGLGPRILRTETAGILGPALVLARYGIIG